MTWRDADRTPVLGRLFSAYLEKRLGPARHADEPLEQRHRNLAASMQAALEEVLAAHWSALAKKPAKNRCASRAASLSIASPTEKYSITRRSSAFTCSRPPEMRAFRRRRIRGESPDSRPPARVCYGPCRMGSAIQRGRKFAPPWKTPPRTATIWKFSNSMKRACFEPPRDISPTAKSSAGFKDASNGARARSASAAFSPTRAARK